MSLGDLLKSRHRHSDPAVRLRAVATLDDPQALVRLACDDPDLEVRLAALERLEGDDALRSVAIEGGHLDTRLKAVARIGDPRVLAAIMRERKNPELMLACFEHIHSQEVLEAIARDPEHNFTARRIAINMFADRELLAEILKTVRAPGLRRAARERLADAGLENGLEAGTEEPPPHPERHMDRLLTQHDPEIVAEMLGAFRDSPAAVRGLGVILARGGAAGDRAAEILERVLRHARPEIRLEALTQLQPVVRRLADDLRPLGESDPDPRVRRAVRDMLDPLDEKAES